MKKLYVFRGLPGSGKSTLARKRAALVVEPDMFRYDPEMNYVFESSMNDSVHMKSDDLLRTAMGLGVQCIATTAVNATVAQVRRYASLGQEYGYSVTVVECRGDYGNVHSVPPQVVAKMAKEFEQLTPELVAELGVAFEVVNADPGGFNKSLKRWAVTYVESGDTCDGRSRVHGVYGSREQAVAELRADMASYGSRNPGAKLDYDDWSADLGDGAGCLWNVERLPR